MGIESVKSSTPAFCRDKLTESFKVIMSGDNDKLIEFIQKIRKNFNQQELINISFPRGVNGINKYKGSSEIYVKGTPIHVRGALLYNHHLKQNKITNKYPEILDGEKIKYLYLKSPNPFGENVIAYIQDLPKEFGLDKYIDYELQFNKAFLDPLKSVVDCIGWQTEKRGSLESFFA